jgi:general secretion pathway protein C
VRIATLGISVIVTGFVGYITASVITSASVFFMMNDSVLVAPNVGSRSSEAESFGATSNHRELQKSIKDRNLFNSEGVFPEEADASDIAAQRSMVFDENAACSKTSLNIELVGTIFLGAQGDSLATIMERGFTQADIYRKGDLIYGNDQAKIHRIEQKRVIINNSGKKECIELDADAAALTALAAPKPASGIELGSQVEAAAGGCTSASLEEKFVTEQLGPGFDRILNGSARLIPHNQDGQMVGFKLISMDASSLFAKICLRSGDVITQVNDASMQQPDQGFALYQALQSERKIRISLLRNGTTPMTINVDIK